MKFRQKMVKNPQNRTKQFKNDQKTSKNDQNLHFFGIKLFLNLHFELLVNEHPINVSKFVHFGNI